MISRTPTGAPGDWHSDAPSISANGRYVAFHSSASNLLPDPVGGGWAQVYVYDRVTGGMRLISRNRIDGGPGGGHSGFPSISADGNFIAYESLAGDLVPSDDNGTTDVFVCRRTASRSTCVSVSTALDEGNSWSDKPSTSADGRYVAFSSAASNLVSGDSNGVTDILVRDVTGGLTTRESLSSTGGQANGPSTRPSISDNGRYVAFDSGASNLAAGDTGSFTDVFIRDRQTQATTRMSVNAAGQGGNDDSFAPSITADGQAVAFHSGAWNFPPPGGTDLRPFQAFMASLAGNTPPQLLWAGGTGYTADGVDPGQGQANATSFRFRVRYRDANGDDPTYVRVIIERDGAAWRTLNMQAGAGAPFWGRLYSLTTRLPTGSYTYRFRAHDDDGGATGQGRVQQNGPTVTDGAVAVAITSLTALPSPAGAHVLFTLARPARITARILNVAGRPVCLLAREAEFPAGIGTLLWSGRSDAGLLAPGGVYVVEVAAQDEGGAESRAVTRLTLSR
jgi:Tol biopolymer transport system component